MSKGTFNRHGRRSGGDRPFKITVPAGQCNGKQLPNLSIQCFEGRHYDCIGCECDCHKPRNPK